GEVASQPGGLQRAPGADESDALDQHDPRARVEQLVRVAAVALEVGLLALLERMHLLDQALAQNRGVVVLGVELDPGGTALGVHEVVGAGRPDLRELARVAPADEFERGRREVDLEHARAVDGERSAGSTSASRLSRCSWSIGGRCAPPNAALALRSATNAAARLIASSVAA